MNPRSLTFAAALLTATLAAPTAAHAVSHRICVRGDMYNFIIDADPYDWTLLIPPPVFGTAMNPVLPRWQDPPSWRDEVPSVVISDERGLRTDPWRLGGLYVEVYEPSTGKKVVPLQPLSTSGGSSGVSYGCTPWFEHESSTLQLNALSVFYSAPENVYFYSTICTSNGTNACGVPVLQTTTNVTGPHLSKHEVTLNGAGAWSGYGSAADVLSTLLVGTILRLTRFLGQVGYAAHDSCAARSCS